MLQARPPELCCRPGPLSCAAGQAPELPPLLPPCRPGAHYGRLAQPPDHHLPRGELGPDEQQQGATCAAGMLLHLLGTLMQAGAWMTCSGRTMLPAVSSHYVPSVPKPLRSLLPTSAAAHLSCCCPPQLLLLTSSASTHTVSHSTPSTQHMYPYSHTAHVSI